MIGKSRNTVPCLSLSRSSPLFTPEGPSPPIKMRLGEQVLKIPKKQTVSKMNRVEKHKNGSSFTLVVLESLPRPEHIVDDLCHHL